MRRAQGVGLLSARRMSALVLGPTWVGARQREGQGLKLHGGAPRLEPLVCRSTLRAGDRRTRRGTADDEQYRRRAREREGRDAGGGAVRRRHARAYAGQVQAGLNGADFDSVGSPPVSIPIPS